jgi:hypothetical protein
VVVKERRRKRIEGERERKNSSCSILSMWRVCFCFGMWKGPRVVFVGVFVWVEGRNASHSRRVGRGEPEKQGVIYDHYIQLSTKNQHQDKWNCMC